VLAVDKSFYLFLVEFTIFRPILKNCIMHALITITYL